MRRALPICLFVLLACGLATAQTRYEAESARLARGARFSPVAYASGGSLVRNLGGENGGSVTFNQLTVARGGLYPVTLQYDVNDDRPLLITVNGKLTRRLIVHRLAARGEISSRTLFLPLQAGTNTLVFSNDNEAGPDLDCLRLDERPVESTTLSGRLESAEGAPLSGVEVRLVGELEAKTLTDAQGRYEFPFLPKGDYYLRPVKQGTEFTPVELYCPAPRAEAPLSLPPGPVPGESRLNFKARETKAAQPAVLQAGRWRIEYDLHAGLADIFCDGQLVIARSFALARLPDTVTSLDYPTRTLRRQPLQDAFGHGTEFLIESVNAAADKMIQRFCLYEDADFFLVSVEVSGKPKTSSNYLAPLVSQTPARFLPAGDKRALFVPFDNDKWVRYCAVPFGTEVSSYEVSALYHNAKRQALVLGSVEHNLWKTGVRSTTSADAVTGLEVFAGAASPKTRDLLPHGSVTGESVRSPRMFVGCFADWRAGLEAYAKANAALAPVRPWPKGVPFGWNSWGKLQGRLTFDKAMQVSDFFARELQPRHFANDGVVYIGLDSGWNRFSGEQLKQFVARCKTNGQEAGIYFTPFAVWHVADDARVEGTDYTFKDLFLYAHGQKQVLDGGVALDPTHPGTRKRIELLLKRFREAGFAYIKADFLAHGALEADRHYDPRVTTGLAAYEQGLKFIADTMGPDLYLNLSIAPLFPAQYANSRRIGCDAFGDIGKTEYTLNSLTYGWWLSGVYDFNDADHVVLDGYTEGENRARVSSSVITGIFLSGDDFSDAGSATGKERALKYLTNPEVNDLARLRKSFRPVEGNTGFRAAELFSYDAGPFFYLAVFNYANKPVTLRVDLARAGLPEQVAPEAEELWSGSVVKVVNPMSLQLGPADAGLYRFRKQAAPKQP